MDGLARVRPIGDNAMSNDFEITNEGPFVLVQPCTHRAFRWLALHCLQDENHTYWGSALVVEHRYIEDLVEAIQRDWPVDRGDTAAPVRILAVYREGPHPRTSRRRRRHR